MANRNLQSQLNTPSDGSESTITVYYQGNPYNADSTHPLWHEIVAGVLKDDVSALDLFDLPSAIGNRARLSERLTYAKGFLFLDGDQLSDGLADHIVRMVQANEDYGPFVALLENIVQNPSANSRKMLYGYVDHNKVTVTPKGILVLYKSVDRTTDGYKSRQSGPAIVNGRPHKNGPVPQKLGDIVEMPRGDVVDEPHSACHTGLHVGAWGYVSNFAGNTKLAVLVHPRNVVSVPSAPTEMKIRVCQYEILCEVTKPYDGPVLHPSVQPALPGSDPIDHGRYLGVSYEEAPNEGAVAGREAVLEVLAEVKGKRKHPSAAALRAMKTRARGASKGLVAYATTGARKWQLVTGDGSQREHWSIP